MLRKNQSKTWVLLYRNHSKTGIFRKAGEIAGNCWKIAEIRKSPAKFECGKLPELAEIAGNCGNCRKLPEITGNCRKLRKLPEIAGNFRKLPEISGNCREIAEIAGKIAGNFGNCENGVL